MSISILLVDEHSVVREGVKAMIHRTTDLTVVAEAVDGEEAIKRAAQAVPDVVIMDLHLPKVSGISAMQQILADCPNTGVLVLSTCHDKSFVMAALKGGARGYLTKDCTAGELEEGVRTVAGGGSYFSESIRELLLRDYATKCSPNARAGAALSDREQEVLQEIANGKSLKETASLLGVSVKTVETHRRRIMQKLGAHNTVELVRYALREGLVSTW